MIVKYPRDYAFDTFRSYSDDAHHKASDKITIHTSGLIAVARILTKVLQSHACEPQVETSGPHSAQKPRAIGPRFPQLYRHRVTHPHTPHHTPRTLLIPL